MHPNRQIGPGWRPVFVASLLALGALSAAVTAEAQAKLRTTQIRQNLFAACFPTPRSGWVVGELGRVFRTDDGGGSWTRQDADTKKPFLAASCVDERTAWIGGKGAILYSTTDGGETWELLTPNTTKHIFDLAFTSRTDGVAVGDWGLLMHTQDAGRTWKIIGIPDDFVLSPMAEDIGLEPSDTILYAASFPDATHGWTVGEFGTILATVDGGRSWHQQRAPVDTTLFGTSFRSPSEGWAVGMDAVIIHTVDGGVTWRRLEAPIKERSLYDVGVAGPHGWIAGDSGTLLKTTDGGQTWRLEPLPIALAANWFRAVLLLPNGSGFITGADGLLFSVEAATVRDLRHDDPPARPGGAS
jgi:photosystem II stability/assembly factor-like uncharacterized protein